MTNFTVLHYAKAYVDQEKAKYLPLHGKADTAGTADTATNADHATVADRLSSDSESDSRTLMGFIDYSKGVKLKFTNADGQAYSPIMTSNGVVIASASASSKIEFKVNGNTILVQRSAESNSASDIATATLCFPVRKNDTVFISADVISATFFPCL